MLLKGGKSERTVRYEIDSPRDGNRGRRETKWGRKVDARGGGRKSEKVFTLFRREYRQKRRFLHTAYLTKIKQLSNKKRGEKRLRGKE